MPRTGNSKPAMVAAALLALLATPPPADATSRYKTVTKTFYKYGTINIPTAGPATPYPPEVSVGGFKRGKILDANLTLDDEAASPMPYYSALATGKYRPTNNGANDYFDPPRPPRAGWRSSPGSTA